MRLIDADALKQVISSHTYPVQDYYNSRDYGMFWTGGIEKAIDEAPTIDAVPFVRCKDCKHFTPGRSTGDWGTCELTQIPGPEYSSCFDGERRDEDNETD